jgi:hypothetical protein
LQTPEYARAVFRRKDLTEEQLSRAVAAGPRRLAASLGLPTIRQVLPVVSAGVPRAPGWLRAAGTCS